MSIAAPAPLPVAERLHRRTMRRLIGTLASLAIAGGLAAGVGIAPVAAAPPASSTRMTGAAVAVLAVIRRFTDTLTPAQRAALAGPTGTGVTLSSLTSIQRGTALGMLRTLLTADAWAVIDDAMRADDALAASGAGEGSGAYVIGYLEDPRGAGAFLQFAGPQLAVNVLLGGDEVRVEPELIDS